VSVQKKARQGNPTGGNHRKTRSSAAVPAAGQ
jgi:hypothetical protein